MEFPECKRSISRIHYGHVILEGNLDSIPPHALPSPTVFLPTVMVPGKHLGLHSTHPAPLPAQWLSSRLSGAEAWLQSHR